MYKIIILSYFITTTKKTIFYTYLLVLFNNAYNVNGRLN